MYKKVNLCAKSSDKLSNSFPSAIGVHQSDVLSPNLFKIFINDLESLLDDSSDPVSLKDLKLHCLMYADDIVLLSESASGLQKALNGLDNFCSSWGMTINVKKTKVLIFNKAGRIDKSIFMMGKHQLENVRKYKYLGIIFQASGVFAEAKRDLYNKALKAFFFN